MKMYSFEKWHCCSSSTGWSEFKSANSNIKHEYLRSHAYVLMYICLSLSSSSSHLSSIFVLFILFLTSIQNPDTRAYILDPCSWQNVNILRSTKGIHQALPIKGQKRICIYFMVIWIHKYKFESHCIMTKRNLFSQTSIAKTWIQLFLGA